MLGGGKKEEELGSEGIGLASGRIGTNKKIKKYDNQEVKSLSGIAGIYYAIYPVITLIRGVVASYHKSSWK